MLKVVSLNLIFHLRDLDCVTILGIFLQQSEALFNKPSGTSNKTNPGLISMLHRVQKFIA